MAVPTLRALLDTHAVVWAAADDTRLGSEIRQLLRASEAKALAISDITLLEISMLVKKERIILETGLRPFLESVSQTFSILPMNGLIAEFAMSLPLPQGDPFDRVIVATASHHQLPLASRDQLIVQSGCVPLLW